MEAESESQSDPESKLWLNTYEELQSIDQFIFSTTLELVREAVACHKNRLYVASLVMCRAALESMLHTLKTWKKEGDRYCLRPVVRTSLPNLVRWATGNSVMTPREAKIANRIKGMGDLSAHIAQRIGFELRRVASCKPYRVWVSEGESWKNLKSTVKLLRALANRWHVKSAKQS